MCTGRFRPRRIRRATSRKKRRGRKKDLEEEAVREGSNRTAHAAIINLVRITKNGSKMKTFVIARNVVGTLGLALIAYVIIRSVPDLGRYIKISRM
jgi:hypothetical protein